MREEDRFLSGVNYWPARKAMYWWKDFSRQETATDFQRIAEMGLRLIRIFLLWEDFQPEPKRFPVTTLNHLVTVLELAEQYGLKVLPTFFTGHMCGLNWIPYWMLESRRATQARYPVYTAGKLHNYKIRNYYTDLEVLQAQVAQLKEISRVLKGHPALWGWDLGHQTSACSQPPDRESALVWLRVMTETLREEDHTLPITMGLHTSDLEEDLQLGPAEVGRYCDFIGLQVYPATLDWSRGSKDSQVVGFLVQITGWLGQRPVLIEGLGVAVEPPGSYPLDDGLRKTLVGEKEAAVFYQQALDLLQQSGCLGALAWCYSDYEVTLEELPPFSEHPEERFFGLFDASGKPKASTQAWTLASNWQVGSTGQSPGWIDLSPEEFYQAPKDHLQRLYHNFLDLGG